MLAQIILGKVTSNPLDYIEVSERKVEHLRVLPYNESLIELRSSSIRIGKLLLIIYRQNNTARYNGDFMHLDYACEN